MLIKVCGMKRQQDLDAASQLGADFCGFIFHAQSPRAISPEQAGALASGRMRRVGVFVHAQMSEIERAADLARLDLIQLHGRQPVGLAASLGPERIVRVLWPESYASREDFQRELCLHAESCAFFLLDSGSGGGGSGKRLGVSWLKTIVWPRPWLLAGGLSPANVGEVLDSCAPTGLDFNSGIERAPGVKDFAAMSAAFEAARQHGGE